MRGTRLHMKGLFKELVKKQLQIISSRFQPFFKFFVGSGRVEKPILKNTNPSLAILISSWVFQDAFHSSVTMLKDNLPPTILTNPICTSSYIYCDNQILQNVAHESAEPSSGLVAQIHLPCILNKINRAWSGCNIAVSLVFTSLAHCCLPKNFDVFQTLLQNSIQIHPWFILLSSYICASLCQIKNATSK